MWDLIICRPTEQQQRRRRRGREGGAGRSGGDGDQREERRERIPKTFPLKRRGTEVVKKRRLKKEKEEKTEREGGRDTAPLPPKTQRCHPTVDRNTQGELWSAATDQDLISRATICTQHRGCEPDRCGLLELPR